MPELPEVETVKLGLQRLITGKTIRSVTRYNFGSFPIDESRLEAFVIGATITTVERRAKVLLFHLSNNYSLVAHLKMTGQFVYRSQTEKFGAGHPSHSLVGPLPDTSTRVQFDFNDDSWLFFNDQRKFGWIRLVPTVEIPQLPFMQKVGPEPLKESFTPEIFISRIRRRARSPIKAALLDQTVLAGIGNIYADESLWAAKIHPGTLVQLVTDAELIELLTHIKRILKLAIAKGGSTDKHYVTAEGKRGNYLDFAQVFRRNGQPCPRCGTVIEKSRVAGRGTHTCPTCQVVVT